MKNTIGLNIYTIYILLWIVFNVVFVTGNPISRPLFVIIFAITVYYSFYALLKYKLPVYFKGLFLLLLLLSISGGILLLNGHVHYIVAANNKEVGRYVYLVTIYKSLLPIFPFYVFSKKGYVKESSFSFWIVVFALATLLAFILTSRQMIFASTSGRTEFTNNQGLVFISIVPLLFLVKNHKMYQYVLLMILTVLSLLSMKRSAMVLSLALVIWFLGFSLKQSSNWRRIVAISSAIIFLILGAVFIDRLYNTSSYFRGRVEATLEGNSSGRDEIANDLLRYFNHEATFSQQIFGSGADATLDITYNYAHNDWLEILINQGIIGVLVYLYYWLLFFKQWRRFNRGSPLHAAFGALIIILLFETLFSMSYGAMSSYTTLCLGYCLSFDE